MNYIALLLNLSSAITGFVPISAFASLVGIPIDIASSVVGLKISVITAVISYEKIKKCDKIKLNSMVVLFYKACIDPYVIHEEKNLFQ